MDFHLDAQTYLTTGVKTITTGFQVKELEIIVTKKAGQANVDIVRSSHGVSDGTNQICDSQYSDGTAAGAGPERFYDRIVDVRERVAGTIQHRTIAVVDQTIPGAAWTATTVSFYVSTADANYQYEIKARG